MRYFMMDPNERFTNRFELLCEYVDPEPGFCGCAPAAGAAQEDDLQREQRHADSVFGHLMIWFARWAGDHDMDAGLFWDVTESRLGKWAEWPSPLKFGRALVKAKYCTPVKDVFPDKLCRGRSGFVVREALELSWDGWHRKQPNAGELVLYMTDAKRRAALAPNYPIDSSVVPPGWLDPPANGGNLPEEFRQDSGRSPPPVRRDGGAAPAAPASPLRDVNVNEKMKLKQRNVTTGKPKTPEMLSTIIHNKYDNPYLAYEAMDDGEYFMNLVKEILRIDPDHGRQILAEMTETDETWAMWGRPAAVAQQRIKTRLKYLKARTRPPREAGAAGAADRKI